MSISRTYFAFLVVLASLIGSVVTYIQTQPHNSSDAVIVTGIDCPEEDSCSPQYDGNSWWIVKDGDGYDGNN